MFVLRTGLQGHSKTLNTIKELDERSKSTGRPVYFHNIRDLQVDKLDGQWIPFENPQEWYELPHNSLIVIDEAQRFFPVRAQASKVPRYASELETMRHQGHELHCITQDPALIDHHMRKLCNSHIHYNRPNKGKLISRWEFERPINPSNKSEFANGQCRVFKLDPRYFDKYTSSQAEHHFKWQPPRALFVLVACLVLLGLAGWKLSGRFDSAPVAETEDQQLVQEQQGVESEPPARLHVASQAEYVDARKPRIAGVPSSAPIYDELTKPVTFPRPSCVSSVDQELVNRNLHRFSIGKDRQGRLAGCRCNSQQGTRMDLSFDMCMSIVENGYFDDTKPDRSRSTFDDGAREAVSSQGETAQPARLSADRRVTAGMQVSSVPSGIHVDGISPTVDARGMKLQP